MKIWKHTDSFKFNNPVVTIGIFDGVHQGHQYLLKKLRSEAIRYGGESVVITLWPHPRLVLNKEPDSLRYLSSMGEKEILLRQSGVDHLVVIEFTTEFAQLESCVFIKEFLVDKVGIKHLVIGFNHKFGKNREGDFESLKTCADIYDFTIDQTDALLVNSEKISSSVIRGQLLTGQLTEACRNLGYDYFLQGSVVGGNRMGRALGFPTANILPHDPHKLIPADGVYAINLKLDDKLYNGMMNIGFRPTLDSSNPVKSIEANIFNFEGDVYGKDVTLIFRNRLRDEKKFESMDQLKEQLIRDREAAMGVLGDVN